MWLELIEAGILVSDFVYHRWIEDHSVAKSNEEFHLPLAGEGTPIPLIFGRTRVRSPVLAWQSTPNVDTSGTLGLSPLYRLSMLFVAGIPFAEGATAMCDTFIGETRAGSDSTINIAPADNTDLVQGTSELKDGNSSQDFLSPTSNAADYMLNDPSLPVPSTDIPSWRGYATVFLGAFGGASGGGGAQNDFVLGSTPNVPAISFEIQSLPPASATNGYPGQLIQSRIAGTNPPGVLEANPADVLWEILTGKFGKLGLDPSLLDYASFQAAAYTLWVEGHGYSRTFDQFAQALDMITEILVQIDGVMWVDPATGLLGLTLIRNDYDPTTLLEVNRTNCSELQNLAIGGLTGLPNQIVLSFTDRSAYYQTGTARSTNQANAVGQDGLVRSVNLSMPGVTTQALADTLAERELAARSRPLIKCTAVCDRSFASVKPGDVVKVTWTKPDIAGLVFRVANVNRGTLKDASVKLDLIQDVFYVWRNRPPVKTGFGGHDSSGISGFSGG